MYRINLSTKKTLILFVAIILVITGVFVAFVTPRALSTYYQMKGGEQLYRVIQQSTDSPKIDFLCEPIAGDNQQGKALLISAEKDLTTAISMNPKNFQAYMQLGNVQCLTGKGGEGD